MTKKHGIERVSRDSFDRGMGERGHVRLSKVGN